jgi:hypothetical protein
MDPLSIVTISSAVGGLAGKLTEKAWDSGEKWLASYFKDHHPKAQEMAMQNSLEFLAEVAQRVHQLELEAKDDQKIKQQIESALEDPDFSALLKDALIASSRTDSEEKHKILARIVSERLYSQSEGLLALTSTLACNAVKHLTLKQIRLLGLITFVGHIRPDEIPIGVRSENYGRWYAEWLAARLSLHLPIELPRGIDFSHLESVSCIQYQMTIYWDLKKLLRPPSTEFGHSWSFEDFIQNNEQGKQLNELWKSGVKHVKPTTTGYLIGIYVHDELGKERTIIDWES